jgi:GT2 family glycosyltransferase
VSTISIVIPTIPGREELLNKLLKSLPRNQKRYERIIIADDFSLAKKRNLGGCLANGKYILFIDDDNYLNSDAIDQIIKAMDKDNTIGVMGMVACYDDKPTFVADGGSIRNYITGFMKGMYTNTEINTLPKEPYEVSEVANAFVVRRKLFRQLQGFDEVHFPIDLDEADFCKRAKNIGYKIMMCPAAICFHKSITYSHIPDFRRDKNAYFMGRNRVFYQKKHSNHWTLFLYFCYGLPAFVLFYVWALMYRKKTEMIKHFLQGVRDGLRNCTKNQYY